MTLSTEGNKSFLQNVYPTILTFTRIKDSVVKQTNKQKQKKKQQEMNIEEFPSENRKPSSVSIFRKGKQSEAFRNSPQILIRTGKITQAQ